jgi:hypothetical protein
LPDFFREPRPSSSSSERASESELGSNLGGSEIVLSKEGEENVADSRFQLFVELPRLEQPTEPSKAGIVGSAKKQTDLNFGFVRRFSRHFHSPGEYLFQ